MNKTLLATVNDDGQDVYTEVNVLFTELIEDESYCLIEAVKEELDATGCALHQIRYYPTHFVDLVDLLKEHLKVGYEIGLVLEEELVTEEFLTRYNK